MSKGFRVTVDDLDHGSSGVRVVGEGDYILLAFGSCYLSATTRHKNGTVQLTIKGHAPADPEPTPPPFDWQQVALKLALQGDGSFRRLSTREADAVRQLVDAERDRQDTAAEVHADRTADAADGGEPR